MIGSKRFLSDTGEIQKSWRSASRCAGKAGDEGMEPIIRISNVSKTFAGKENTVEALKNISLDIEAGDIYGIIGMSGAGKSTLVRCLNFLERPTKGTVYVLSLIHI